MKLSYKKYPIFRYADKKFKDKKKTLDFFKKILNYPIYDEKQRNCIRANIKLVEGLMYDKPIYIPSDAFIKGINNNIEKINLTIPESTKKVDVDENCIAIIQDWYVCIQNIINDEFNEFYIFNINGDPLYVMLLNKKSKYLKFIFSDDNENEFAITKLQEFFSILLFKKYASVELEIIEAGKNKQLKNAEKNKIINELGVDAIFLDSSWFREIIRNEGFKVRGHFRLQPYKDENGQWTRKLIYINEFEKHGYHRKAKMTVEQETIEQATL